MLDDTKSAGRLDREQDCEVFRDPAKRIIAFGVALHEGELRPVLLVNNGSKLIIASHGLSREQAGILCDGYVDGLRESEDLSEDLINAFLNDPEAMAALDVPLDRSVADKELFKQGTIGGLNLATAGYWLDLSPAAVAVTVH
jgi:hypothetical protein